MSTIRMDDLTKGDMWVVSEKITFYEEDAWPLPTEAPSSEDLSKCVHCGLCLNACPTYLITGLEVESPRGRIHLARSVGEGRISLTKTVQNHWDLCLQCRACEAVCPSGVPYGKIMTHAKAQIIKAEPSKKFTLLLAISFIITSSLNNLELFDSSSFIMLCIYFFFPFLYNVRPRANNAYLVLFYFFFD